MSSLPYVQKLPDLAHYRAEFIGTGLRLPLPCVEFKTQGLLASLPRPAPEKSGWPWTIEGQPVPVRDAPLFSVVVPSYQQGRFLEETLRSILLQNYPRTEVIVMDGGSSDETCRVLEAYRPWLSFVRAAKDRGQSHAINLGLSLASGDIHGWVNSDDFYLPGALADVADAYRRGAEFIYGDSVELDDHTGQRRLAISNYAHPRYARFPGLVPQPSVFWAARRLQPLWEEQQCALDYELWIRLLPGLRRHYIRRALSVARKHDAAKTYSPLMKQRWAADAERNGLAHPHLYRPGPKQRWLQLEYRVVQRLIRFRRQLGASKRAAQIAPDCTGDRPRA